MTTDLTALTAKMIDAAKRAGADHADAIAVEGRSVSIGVRGGVLETAERSESTDIGLRVLIGQKQACVSASDSRDETIETLAERVVAMAKLAPDDPQIGLADSAEICTSYDADALELYDPSPEPSSENLLKDAQAAEAAALSRSGISQAKTNAAYGARRIALSLSNGFSGQYQRNERALSVTAIAGEGMGMERDYAGEGRVFAADMPPPNEIGRTASERAVARLDARKPKTGAYPVLYDERISSSLIGHLLSAINGAAIARGSSWLLDAMGEQVLPKALSLTEDPTRARGPLSRPFDGEGLPVQTRDFVKDGVLQSWILDLATARKLNLNSTGNAARGVSSPPSPSVTNIALGQGEKSQEALLKDMGTGLLVTSMIGASINPNTGDYSRGASGFWVENGEIAYPVNECTIAGNLRDMLRSLTPANDARRHKGYVVPSLLVEGMTLAGD